MSQARIVPADGLRRLGRRLFEACGAPAEEAALVAEELVEASLRGLDSHGVIRFAQYVEDALAGRIRPGAPLRIVRETPGTAMVDCGFNFGPVTATRMAEITCRKARSVHVACVVSRNGGHVGRLGAYVEKIAAEGLFGFAVANSSKHGHFVAPWGGTQGRLATNPLAFAAPTSGDPIVLDMSTSMISEGKIRVLLGDGKPVPRGSVRDAAGQPTSDPKAFYGPPRGTIQPFGSDLGYKGFGLGLLVEILGGVLAGHASAEDLPYVNGLCLIAIDPDAFCGRERFRELLDALCDYVTSCPPGPGYSDVAMPGTLDFRMRQKRLREGIPVPASTWNGIVELAGRLGVQLNDLKQATLPPLSRWTGEGPGVRAD